MMMWDFFNPDELLDLDDLYLLDQLAKIKIKAIDVEEGMLFEERLKKKLEDFVNDDDLIEFMDVDEEETGLGEDEGYISEEIPAFD